MILTDEEILELLDLPEYLNFIDTNKLEIKNHFRLFVEVAKLHIADYNNNPRVTKKIENVQVKIIDNQEEINGYSFFYEGNNVICINSGAIMKIMEVILSFVENPDFMPTIGKVSKNNSSERVKSKVINNKMEWITSIEDITRQDLAYVMQYFACLSLIYHEIGHLIHGHTQLGKNNAFKYLSICEMSSKIDKGLSLEQLLDKRTIEMDADAYAMSHILYTAEAYYNKRSSVQGGFITSKEMMVEILINSITIAYLILQDKENIGFDNIEYSTHLPALYRMILAVDSLRTTANNTPSKISSYEKMSEQIFKSAVVCLNMYNSIWLESKSNEAILYELTCFSKYYDPICNNWDILRDELSKFSYVQLPKKYKSEK